MGITTSLVSANQNDSLRVIVPASIVRQFKLGQGDHLEWHIVTSGNKLKIEVIPVGYDGLERLIILLADASGEPIHGRTKLQAMVFLLADIFDEIKEQCSSGDDNYGPYSGAVDEKMARLEQVGVLSNTQGKISTTSKGSEAAKAISKEADSKIVEEVYECIDFLDDLTDDEILTFVYCAWPDTARNSAEYKKLEPKIQDHVLSLLKKEKVTASRASELLDSSIQDIFALMKEHNLPR